VEVPGVLQQFQDGRLKFEVDRLQLKVFVYK
jgi:hypothetical protein